jgi:hypothetical protein
VTGIFDVSDELFLSEISRPMSPETLVKSAPIDKGQPEEWAVINQPVRHNSAVAWIAHLNDVDCR